MKDIKEKLNAKIEALKEEEIKKFENLQKAITEGTNPARIIDLSSKALSNSSSHKETIKEVVKKFFSSDFSKESEIKFKTNYVALEGLNYFISIPSSYLKSITVGRKDPLKSPEKKKSTALSKDEIILLNMYKEGHDKKELVKHFKIFKGLGFFSRARYSDVLKEVKEIESRRIKIKTNEDIFKREIINFEKEKIQDILFLQDVKEDIGLFANENWSIAIENIDKTAIETLKEDNRNWKITERRN